MKTPIEMIYFGDIDVQNIPETKEWKRLHRKVNETNELLVASLTEEQKILFDKLSEYESAREVEMQLQCYKTGFKLGLALAAESFFE